MGKQRAYVLGAGVSGLVTAWKLLEHGWEVDIIEKEPHYGGMSRTWRWGDFLLDVGPHIYHTPDERMAEFWEREFGDLLIKKDLWCKNVIGDRYDHFYDYPISFEAIAEYPQELREQILGELGSLNGESKVQARSYKEYVTALVGPTLQRMFFERYPRKLWGLSTEEMTASWAPKRIELRAKKTPFYIGQYSAVGRYGTGCVYDRIYNKIIGLGGRVRLGQGVVALDSNGTGIRRLILAGSDSISLEPRDVIVSTIPINVLARLLKIPCTLTFRGITSVYLAFGREHAMPEGVHFLYYDSPELLFNRVSEPKSFSEEVAPPDRTCLTAEIAYSSGDEIDRTSPDMLISKVLDQLCRTGLVANAQFCGGSVQRQPCVYPLLYRDYQHELARAQSRIGEFKQIYSIGTTGEFNYADSQILFLKAFDLVDLLTNQFSEFTQYKRKHYAAALSRVVTLRGRSIGDGNSPYIIAEAGLNHNGNRDLALRLITEAAAAGCDAIKFQTYASGDRISGKVKKVRYADTTLGSEETLLEMFRRLELSLDDHRALFAHAQEKGIQIFSTPFDFSAVDLLESLGVSLYKIASFDLVNLPLIRYVASTGKPMILSTGMSALGQVEEALETVRGEGNPNVVLLHCVSSYPAAAEEMNLKAIQTLKTSFGVPAGLSDHTLGIMVSQVAMGLGANVIERHFTLDRTFEGPDHILSSVPEEMRDLVRCARSIDKILGDGIKRVQPSEYEMINTQRKSLYASVDIPAGSTISRAMIALKGPGLGIQPKYLDIVLGRVARLPIAEDHPITWEAV